MQINELLPESKRSSKKPLYVQETLLQFQKFTSAHKRRHFSSSHLKTICRTEIHSIIVSDDILHFIFHNTQNVPLRVVIHPRFIENKNSMMKGYNVAWCKL